MDFGFRFQFHDDVLVYEKISSKATFLVDFIVDYWHWMFFQHFETSFPQFVCEALTIDRFEETGAKSTMNLDRGADDFMC